MKKRINLFQHNAQIKTPQFVTRVKQYTLGISMVLFIVFLSVNALFLWSRLRLNSLNQAKSNLLSTVIDNKDIEAQIIYFSKKQAQLNGFLKDDSQFLPYYNLLKDLLVFSSNSPVLENMTLDKTKTTDFVVGFSDFSKTYDFLHYVESDSFLQNFLDLKLEKFSIAETGIQNKGYELRFHGQFRDLNETNI